MTRTTVFWNWFAAHSGFPLGFPQLGARQQRELLFMMTFHLDVYCEGLCFVLTHSAARVPAYTLHFSAMGDSGKFDLVRALVRDAPVLPHWQFVALVQPKFDILTLVDGLDAPFVFGDVTIKASTLQFSVLAITIATQQLSLVVYLPDYPIGCSPSYLHSLVFIVAQELLGEALLFEHLTCFTVQPLPAGATGLPYLYDLPLFLETVWE